MTPAVPDHLLPSRARRLWLPVVAAVGSVLLGAALLGDLALRQREAARGVTHTVEVIATADNVKLSVESAISDARAFMFSHDEAIAEERQVRSARAFGELRDLLAMTADNPAQQAQTAALRPMLEERFAISDAVVVLIREHRDAEVTPLLRARGAAARTEAIYDALDVIASAERELLRARTAASASAIADTLLAIGLAAVVLATALAAMLIAITRHQAAVHESRVALLEERRQRDRQGQVHTMRTVGRLAAGIAHDFNNILQVVLGALGLCLEDAALDPETRALIVTAQQSGARGATLVKQLLAYSGQQTLRPVRIDPVSFLAETCRLLQRALEPSIEVSVACGRATGWVMADPGQLHTALLSLAINAGQAMPAGGRLTLGARDTAENCIAITVTDTGTGMSAETIARASEPFFTTRGARGSGLGLSMVDGFARQSGGSMTIASDPGRGTEVALILPAVASPSGDGARVYAALEG